MSQTYSFNPATGQGEVVTPNMTIPEPSDVGMETEVSHQEKAAFWEENARANTAQHLTQRRLGTAGDIQSSDLELFQVQAEYQRAQESGDYLRAQQLEAKVMQLAQTAVAGGRTEDHQADRDVPEVGDITDLRAGLRTDATVAEGMRTTEALVEDGVLPESVLEAVQSGLSSEDVEQLEGTADLMKTVSENPHVFNRVEDVSQVGALTSDEIGQLTDMFGAEVADQIKTLNYGIRSGDYSFDQIFQIARHKGLVGPLMKAAAAGVIQIASY